MSHVAEDTPTVTDTDGWNRFAKCLLVTFSDSPNKLEFSVRAYRGDVLYIVEEDNPDHSLGGRLIYPDRLNI